MMKNENGNAIDVAHFLKSICNDTDETKKLIEQFLTDLAAEVNEP